MRGFHIILNYIFTNLKYILLQFGMDTRQEGLSWIIKALWILGENVKI